MKTRLVVVVFMSINTKLTGNLATLGIDTPVTVMFSPIATVSDVTLHDIAM